MPTAPVNNAAVEWAHNVNANRQRQQDIVSRQTAMILEKDRQNKEKDKALLAIRQVAIDIHKRMTDVIPNYNETRLPFETAQQRMVKTGELMAAPTEKLIAAIYAYCRVYQTNADANRQAFALIESDVNYDDDLDVLDRLERESSQKKNDVGSLSVAQNIAASRPITPDAGLGDLASGVRSMALPPSPPDSTHPKEKGGQEKTGKSKTTTLEKLAQGANSLGASLSGTAKSAAPASPTVKSPTAKTSGTSKKSSQNRNDDNTKGRGDQV